MDAVEEVKGRLNIEDVVSEYLPLKRSGRNFKALSPFTNEKTASLIVSPDKQIWKDFSSGKGGSLFDFVMIMEGVDFKGALELLARKAGVDLEQYQTNRMGPNKERLFLANELSAKFYQAQFASQTKALRYVLETRGFSKQTALDWQLGYSPNTGSALIQFLAKEGFSPGEIKQAGLSSQNYKGKPQDMFRGRLMIPLKDITGRVIGFTARLLEDNPRAPKYLNTPQTPLYDKSRHVYGLDKAKQSIRTANFAVLVEGNLDVIASHQAGVAEAVATAGTALTEFHLKTLSRLSADIRLCFDQDRAGLAATERAVPLASKANVSLSIIDVPSGKDPDELIRRSPKQWQAAVNNNVYALDWLIKRYRTKLDLSSAVGKRQFSDILLPVVKSLADPVEIDHYLNVIAKVSGVSRSALEQKLDSSASPKPRRRLKAPVQIAQADKASVEQQKNQDQFLSLMLMRPTLRQFIELIDSEMLYTDEAKSLLEQLKAEPELNVKQAIKATNLKDYVKIEVLLYEELYQDIELNELFDEAARLQAELVTKFVKHEKEKLAQAYSRTSDEVTLRALQETDKRYNNLLNQVKGAAHG